MKLLKKFAASASMLLVATGAALADWKPTRPVEFVVSAGAGGGTDNFARTIQLIITKYKLMDSPIVVLNKGAGSGAEAFLYGKQHNGDPHKLIFATNNVYLLPHVTNMAYKASDMVPVAALAMDEFILWVNGSSEYNAAKDLIEAAKAQPGKLAVAGSQAKDVDQTLVALIKQVTGAEFKYMPFNGGGEAAVQLAGNHVTANVNNPNENLGQWQAGGVKPLCVFAPKAMTGDKPIYDGKGWGDIPTCKSAGIDIAEYRMPRTVWLPAGTDPESVTFYTDLMKKVFETPEFKAYLTTTSQTGDLKVGGDLASFITQSEANAVKVFEAEGWAAK
jgi:putative tricarboxylic transport membrane protein